MSDMAVAAGTEYWHIDSQCEISKVRVLCVHKEDMFLDFGRLRMHSKTRHCFSDPEAAWSEAINRLNGDYVRQQERLQKFRSEHCGKSKQLPASDPA